MNARTSPELLEPMHHSLRRSEHHDHLSNAHLDALEEETIFILREVAAAFERLCAQQARGLGLRPEFPFQRLAAWAKNHGGAELIERRKVKPFGVYTLVRFRRCEAQSAAA